MRDTLLQETIYRYSGRYSDAAEIVARGVQGARSIDEFLQSHADNQEVQEVGKWAIASKIMEAERTSRLNGDSGSLFKNVSGTWYGQLFPLLVGGKNKHEFAESLANVGFVVFNYDRCLEWFFVVATSSYFSVDFREAAQLVGKLKVVHPYGHLGKLADITYGHLSLDVSAVAKNLRTYTETTDNDVQDELDQLIHRATKLVFLGFAYHQMNMQLISYSHNLQTSKDCFGTASGMSDPDREYVRNMLSDEYGCPSPNVANSTCFEFLRDYQRSISSD